MAYLTTSAAGAGADRCRGRVRHNEWARLSRDRRAARQHETPPDQSVPQVGMALKGAGGAGFLLFQVAVVTRPSADKGAAPPDGTTARPPMPARASLVPRHQIEQHSRAVRRFTHLHSHPCRQGRRRATAL